MIMEKEMLSMILVAGNLLIAGSLFLYACKNVLVSMEPSGAWKSFGIWILETAVFITGMVRITGIIIEGIELPENPSQALSWVRVFFAESMICLYLLWRVWKERNFLHHLAASMEGRSICSEGGCFYSEGGFIGPGKSRGKIFSHISFRSEREYVLAMFLVLILTITEWDEKNTEKAFILQTVLLLMAALLLYFRNTRQKEQFTDDNHEILTLQQQKQNEYLKNVDLQYQKTRELWHDLKNHINVLEILAKEERVSELADYLKSFRQDVEIHMLPMKTGCTAVDALLSDKLYHARKANIQISLQLCNLSETNIRHTDLCTVLGNLLDNALEACDRLPGNNSIDNCITPDCRKTESKDGIQKGIIQKGMIQKKIILNLKQQDTFYYLTVINSAPEPSVQEGKYVSLKKGQDNVAGHGLGLRSVERIAHQYGGSMVTDYAEGEFRVILRMENPAL